MSRLLKNIWLVISGLLIIGVAGLIVFTSIGSLIIVSIVSVALLIYAFKQIWIYLTNARFMVGGLTFLFKGMIVFDLAVFLFTLNDLKPQYVMLYMVILYLVSGAIDVFRAIEIKKLHDKSWKVKLIYGLFDIALSIVCIIFLGSYQILCYIYAFGLILKGIKRITEVFKKERRYIFNNLFVFD